MIMIDIKQLERFPVTKVWFDRGYWHFLVEYEDLPMRSVTIHKCEDYLDELSALNMFADSHAKQCEMDVKRYLEGEELIDPMIRKKYL